MLGSGALKHKSVGTRCRFADVRDLEKQVKRAEKARKRQDDYNEGVISCLKLEHEHEKRILRKRIRALYEENEALQDEVRSLRERTRKMDSKKSPGKKQ